MFFKLLNAILMLLCYIFCRFLGSGLLTEMNHNMWYKRRVIMDPAFHKKYESTEYCA